MKITNVEGIRKDDLINFLNQIEGNPIIKCEQYDGLYSHTDEILQEVEFDIYEDGCQDYILLKSEYGI